MQSSSQIATTNKPTSKCFTGRMPFLTPNTVGVYEINIRDVFDLFCFELYRGQGKVLLRPRPRPKTGLGKAEDDDDPIAPSATTGIKTLQSFSYN